ncbi:MAG: hypothetical protein HYZ46_02420 [Nitrosomonadales bacterium]|nr:hypothetical protein [Nitrosomonadales bacterium]
MQDGIEQDQPLARSYPRGVTMKLLYAAVAALLLYLIAWVAWLHILGLLVQAISAQFHRPSGREHKTVALPE